MRKLLWAAPAVLKAVKAFPDEVRHGIGFALYLAQEGGKSPDAKPMKGFGGTGVLEIVEDHRGDTYRAVYTVKFANAIYVLHAFQKKSKTGVATPKQDMDTIKERLAAVERHHAENYSKAKRGVIK